MPDRVAFLPLDFVSTLPFRFKHLSEDDLGKFMELLTEAFSRGYHDGYVRGMTEESGRQYVKDQRDRVAVDPDARP